MRVDVADPDPRLVAHGLLQYGQGLRVRLGEPSAGSRRRRPGPGSAASAARLGPSGRRAGSAPRRRPAAGPCRRGGSKSSIRDAAWGRPGRRPRRHRPAQHRGSGGVLRHRGVAGVAQRVEQPGGRVRAWRARWGPAGAGRARPAAGRRRPRLISASSSLRRYAPALPTRSPPWRRATSSMRYSSVCGSGVRDRRRNSCVDVRRRVAGVQGPADAVRGDPVDGRAAPRLGVGDRRQIGGEPRLRRAGHDHGQVGLHQHVVDRRRQQRVERGHQLIARRRTRPGCPADRRPGRAPTLGQQHPPVRGQRVEAGDAERGRLDQRGPGQRLRRRPSPRRPVAATARPAGPCTASMPTAVPGGSLGQYVEHAAPLTRRGGPVGLGATGR